MSEHSCNYEVGDCSACNQLWARTKALTAALEALLVCWDREPDATLADWDDEIPKARSALAKAKGEAK